MSKYIDADKLKAEIERRRLQNRYIDTEGYENELLEIIDSLQQEQPDFPTTDEQMKEFLATHPKVEVPNKYKTPDWLWKKQEQPSLPNNLDEAAREYMKKARKHLFDDSPIGRADDAFKAGAKWMAKQHANDVAEAIESAFNAGKEWMAGQGYTVDGIVFCDKELTGGYKDIVMSIPDELKVNDKVTIQIRKKEEKR